MNVCLCGRHSCYSKSIAVEAAGQRYSQVDTFVYLGSTIGSSVGDVGPEIQRRTGYAWNCFLKFFVVDSHIQRIVLATEETTVTQQVSHRPIKCQSRLWSQRGTKVNGSHHGDNPLLRPAGIQIATKSNAALQAMAPTNIKTVHQTSLLHIESNLDRLGMLSPNHDQGSQQKNGKITLQPVLINNSKSLTATHCTEIRKIEIPRSMVVEALSW